LPADQAAGRVSLDRPRLVSALLDRLRAAGAQDQVTALASRAAAQVSLADPDGVSALLGSDRTIVDRLAGWAKRSLTGH
jgi:hypothetical protein